MGNNLSDKEAMTRFPRTLGKIEQERVENQALYDLEMSGEAFPKTMTDQEIVCAFMEPRPELPLRYSHLAMSPKSWWVLCAVEGGGMRWYPGRFGYVGLGLGPLWEVEERLTDEQWDRYEDVINCHDSPRGYLHATPERKIKALAAVLRPLVESC